ncbi:MAG: cellulase (glycosyl hydrolase family 5), partial [Chitinivibrionales bacterium]|nr:cellulase (glycosyl hydrolase family 5) [Chitinivibrionales bacterium]
MHRRGSLLVIGLVLTAVWATNAQRLTVSGTEILCNGSRIWLNAANTPWNNWNDFGGSYNSSWWDAEFAQIKAAGGNATRIWINCNGDCAISIGSDGTVSGASSKHWSDLDDLFALARQHEIYVMATLISFDHTTSPNTNYLSWRAMYNSDAAVSSFVDNYVTPFVNRYKSNPYLAMVEPCNEIEWVHETPERGDIAWSRLQYYLARVAAAVHEHSDVLVTQGCSVKWQSDIAPACEGNFFSDANLRAQYDNTGAYLDIYSPHWY